MLPYLCVLVWTVAADQPSGYDIRTEVPPIDSGRWTGPPAPLPVVGNITRNDYLTFIRRTYETRKTGRWPLAGDPKIKGQYLDALQASFFWAAEKDQECARMALKFVRGDLAHLSEGDGADKGIGFNVLVPAIQSWLSFSATAYSAPPEGFVSLFNGRDLGGWMVREPDNHDWSVVNGAIDCNPQGEAKGDRNLWTVGEYADFELLVEWRIKESPYVNRNGRIILPDGTYKKDAAGEEIAITVPNTDSGVFLRGQHKSQVNIWCWPVGSGEVWGYRTDRRFPAEVASGVTPKVRADRPIGQWNTFRITIEGDRLTVVLNDTLVIDRAQLPGVPAKGPVALQHHGDRKDGDWGASLVQFRNIYIKERKR